MSNSTFHPAQTPNKSSENATQWFKPGVPAPSPKNLLEFIGFKRKLAKYQKTRDYMEEIIAKIKDGELVLEFQNVGAQHCRDRQYLAKWQTELWKRGEIMKIRNVTERMIAYGKQITKLEQGLINTRKHYDTLRGKINKSPWFLAITQLRKAELKVSDIERVLLKYLPAKCIELLKKN
eukprot:153524_1